MFIGFFVYGFFFFVYSETEKAIPPQLGLAGMSPQQVSIIIWRDMDM